MKIDDILLEYDRARAAQAVGSRLWQAMIRDILNLNIPLTDFQKAWEEKYPFSYKQYVNVFTDKAAQEKLMNNALEQLESADPTTNKKYTQWMARMFASDPRTKLEDIASTAAEYLHKFNILSRKRLLKPEHGDINRFKDLKTFMNVLDYYDLPEEDQPKGKAEKLYSDEDVTVIHPEDEAAACAYGRQTRWCTASTRGMNYFDNYNAQGPLYILIPKSPEHQGEKYQLHFPSNQYMNEDDEQVPLVSLITERFPGLLEFFRAKVPWKLNNLIELAPDDVLKPLLDEIADIMIDHINDIVADWEVDDQYYYKWLRDEGFVDDDEVKDTAPSYLEYNDDARRFYEEAVDAVKLDPADIRKLTREYNRIESDDRVDIYNLEDIMIWNMHQELGRDSANSLAEYMRKRVHVFKDKEGNWQVKRIAKQ